MRDDEDMFDSTHGHSVSRPSRTLSLITVLASGLDALELGMLHTLAFEIGKAKIDYVSEWHEHMGRAARIEGLPKLKEKTFHGYVVGQTYALAGSWGL